MRTNHLHQVIIDEDDMVDVLYRSEEIDHLIVETTHWIERFNKNCAEYGLKGVLHWAEESEQDAETFIQENLADWRLPQAFADLDLENYLLSKCNTEEQRERVRLELDEFNDRDMITVLRWMAYFVATLREKQMIWGVGRGSSVASYVLFLLDVHRVDSLEYELDIKEFLK